MPFFIVTKEDTVVQLTDYVVQAEDIRQAEKFVDDGRFISESLTETIDTIQSKTKSVVELIERKGLEVIK